MMEIPVVFSTDNNYACYCGVALKSLIDRASADNLYKVYILFANLTDKNQARLKTLEAENVLVEFVDVSGLALESGLTESIRCNHIAVSTTYRMFIPKLFPQHKKVLYLDCDIVILRDVAELYNEDIDGYIIGAARENIYKDLFFYLANHIDVPAFDYFNNGITLINTEMFEQHDIRSKAIELLLSGKKYMTLDQDVMNITCEGKVKFFSRKWNFTWEFSCADKPILNKSGKFEKLELDYSDLPYIIHYTTHIKPWNSPEEPFAEFFWDVARRTIFYEEILFKNCKKNSAVKDLFHTFMFPFGSVRKDSSIVLYGAGNVGQTFRNQLKLTDYCKVLMVCDKNYQKYADSGFAVHKPEDMLNLPFDSVVISIESETISNEVKTYLKSLGVKEELIVWVNPNK